MKILVVDDNRLKRATICKYIANILATFQTADINAEIIQASCIQEGISACDKYSDIAIIFSDMQMPNWEDGMVSRIGGVIFAKHVQAKCNIPIVFVSSEELPDAVSQCEFKGGILYDPYTDLQKEFDKYLSREFIIQAHAREMIRKIKV